MKTTNVKAFGTKAADADLKEMTIDRRDVTAKDIEIDIFVLRGLPLRFAHCPKRLGRNDVSCRSGHEIVGEVATRNGRRSNKIEEVGDLAGVALLGRLLYLAIGFAKRI